MTITAKGMSFCGLISATKLRVKPATQSNITFPRTPYTLALRAFGEKEHRLTSTRVAGFARELAGKRRRRTHRANTAFQLTAEKRSTMTITFDEVDCDEAVAQVAGTLRTFTGALQRHHMDGTSGLNRARAGFIVLSVTGQSARRLR